MGTQLRVEGEGCCVFGLLEPAVDVDVVHAKTVEIDGVEIGGGAVAFRFNNAVRKIFRIHPCLARFQHHEERFPISSEDVLQLLQPGGFH